MRQHSVNAVMISPNELNTLQNANKLNHIYEALIHEIEMQTDSLCRGMEQTYALSTAALQQLTSFRRNNQLIFGM